MDDHQIGATARDETAPSRRTILGRSPIFTPEVIDDIHMKAELGRYRMRGFSMFKKIPHWDELIFLPGTLTRFVIEGYREKCVTKTVLGARFAKKPLAGVHPRSAEEVALDEAVERYFAHTEGVLPGAVLKEDA